LINIRTKGITNSIGTQKRSYEMKERTARLLEFLVVGIGMGITEDVLAIWLVSGESVELKDMWLVLTIALPFAFISEWVVDHPDFPKHLLQFKKK
jgi:hypothetical protein